jgi:hypothetical protein
MKPVRLLTVMAVLLVAATASAGFRAADLVVIPVAAATPGLEGSNWRSDVEILNVDTVAVDVLIIFLPSGGSGNYLWYSNIENHLGGRASDGFGKIDENLKDIAPGASVLVGDIVRTHWGEGLKGALLIFAYEANSYSQTTPPGGRPKKIIAHSRTYDYKTNDAGEEIAYGQQINGLPWYDYMNPSLEARGYNKVVLAGIRQDSAYRSAVGVVNISDPLTTVYAELTLKGADGTQLSQRSVIMLPLAHQQFDLAVWNFFGVDPLTDVVGGTVEVRISLWESQAGNPVPALMAYASRVNNRTNDPVQLEQAWLGELPWDCVYNGKCTGVSAQSAGSARLRRPLDPPTP